MKQNATDLQRWRQADTEGSTGCTSATLAASTLCWCRPACRTDTWRSQWSSTRKTRRRRWVCSASPPSSQRWQTTPHFSLQPEHPRKRTVLTNCSTHSNKEQQHQMQLWQLSFLHHQNLSDAWGGSTEQHRQSPISCCSLIYFNTEAVTENSFSAVCLFFLFCAFLSEWDFCIFVDLWIVC